MDLMLSLSQHCGLEGGLAQQSAPGGGVGGGWGGEQGQEEDGGWAVQHRHATAQT